MAVQEDKDLSGYREAERKAFETAPIFMQELGDSEMTSCMHYGLSWGEGWDKPFLETAKKIEDINKELKYNEIVALQCKEKFGLANVYFELRRKDNNYLGAIDERKKQLQRVWDIIDEFERIAHNTCEYCGADISENKFMTKRYISYLCEACAKETKREYKKVNKGEQNGKFNK